MAITGFLNVYIRSSEKCTVKGPQLCWSAIWAARAKIDVDVYRRASRELPEADRRKAPASIWGLVQIWELSAG